MATLTFIINLAWHINLRISFYLEGRFKYCSSYSFVWDEVWTEANTWKVWFGCKDGKQLALNKKCCPSYLNFI